MAKEQNSGAGLGPTPQTADNRFPFVQIISLAVIGLGIGWLVGLSISPVIAGVIASLLGIAGSAASVFGGISSGKITVGPVDARPIAILVVGVAIGASMGIYARTHDILSPLTEVRPEKQSVPTSQQSNLAGKTLLFAVPGSEECVELLATGPDSIRTLFRSSNSEHMQRLGDRIEDNRDLIKIAEALCQE